MKTLCRVEDGSSFVCVDDSTIINLLPDRVIIGTGKDTYTLSDHTVESVQIYEGVTAPDDWKPHAYCFDGTTWTPNPIYVQNTVST